MDVLILALDAPGAMRWHAGHTGTTHIGAYALYAMVSKKLLDYGPIEFGNKSERDDLVLLRRTLDRLNTTGLSIVVVEHPFLHAIAQFVGAVKMWVASKRRLSWYMINPSQAQRLVFGRALHKTRITTTGRTVSDSQWKKDQVRRYVRRTFKLPASVSQHEADAIFYAVAVAARIREAGS